MIFNAEYKTENWKIRYYCKDRIRKTPSRAIWKKNVGMDMVYRQTLTNDEIDDDDLTAKKQDPTKQNDVLCSEKSKFCHSPNGF